SLTSALRHAVNESPADVLLLSGGVDSATLAALDPRPVAITVVLAVEEDSPRPTCGRCADWASRPPGCGEDGEYAGIVARHLELDWRLVRLSPADAMATLADLIRLSRGYDLGLLNDIPLLAGLRHAQHLGLTRVRTGDDADSLFGGYSYLRAEPDWGAYLTRRIPTIRPPIIRLGAALGMEISLPYLHSAVLKVARKLSRQEIATTRPGFGAFVDQFDPDLTDGDEKPWGKLVLRQVAATLLPERIAWRPKTDLQFGAGMCQLETALAALAPPSRHEDTHGRFFNPAHRGMRVLFDRAGLTVPLPGPDEVACDGCGAGLAPNRLHCPTCGAYLAH
nr:asparagine synthase C-terminal domain-containing protein [Chloroflexota bacterium]